MGLINIKMYSKIYYQYRDFHYVEKTVLSSSELLWQSMISYNFRWPGDIIQIADEIQWNLIPLGALIAVINKYFSMIQAPLH